jgi:hypothetical protein
MGRVYRPCATATYVEWVASLIAREMAPNTIRTYMSGVRTWMPEDKKPGTAEDRGMLAEYRKEWGKRNRARKAPPITDAMLRAMVDTCDLRRPITVLIRPKVQHWSSQPCAAGPLANSASSWANCFSLSLGSDAGPCDRRACEPPSSHICRHRCTERTLTRWSLAITQLASPWANLSAALSRNSSQNCCRSAVSRPLVDTACPGDTAADDEPSAPTTPRVQPQ